MKTFIVAALLSIAAVATLGAPANADGSLSVHGTFGGNSYGR
jgi:hypothetical protein